jgi:hypothetical protein
MIAFNSFRSRWISRSLLAAILLAAGGNLADAQLPNARMSAVYPLGGQRGVTVESVMVHGTDLDESTRLVFNHPGITAAVKSSVQAGKLVVQYGTFDVTIAADVPPGLYEVRSAGLFGLSTPRVFVVGDRPEIRETEPNNAPDVAGAVELNTVVNGVVSQALDLDWYKLELKAGQRIIVDCRASRIDSRLKPLLEMYDSNGRILTRAHHTRREDAVLDFTAPGDGEYRLRVSDFTFAGGIEYGYRLIARTGPYIDFVLPASAVPGTASEITVYGRNLPGGQPSPFTVSGRPLEQLKVSVTMPADATAWTSVEGVLSQSAGMDNIAYSLVADSGTSNAVPLFFATAPVALEAEPNSDPASPQIVAPPFELTGQFADRGDVDHYQFEAKTGDTWWIEVFGERNGSAADPVLVVEQLKTDDKGVVQATRVAAVDDDGTNPAGPVFSTATDDPQFRFVASSDGNYRVTIRDRYYENRGSPLLTYRLRMRAVTPDFRLAAIAPQRGVDPNVFPNPASLLLRKGDTAVLNVVALRDDGFDGPIALEVQGLPPGVTASPASLPRNASTTAILFTSSEDAPHWSGPIRLTGKAKLNDPAAEKALQTAEKAVDRFTGELAAAVMAATTADATAKSTAEAAVTAKAAADADPNNADKQKAKTDAEAAAVKAAEAFVAANQKKASLEEQLTAAQAAVAAARQSLVASARELVREARPATTQFPYTGQAGKRLDTRLTETLTLSVLSETAPWQVVAQPVIVEANQSRQVLLSANAIRRAGFDDNIAVTFVGQPQNLQVENKPIAKGANAEVFRLFVNPNLGPGTYPVLAVAQANVQYRRNPAAADQAVEQQQLADKFAVEAADAARKATEAKTAAEQKLAAATQAQQQATAAKTTAEQAAVAAEQAAAIAVMERVAATAALSAAQVEERKATAAKVVADRDAATAELALKQAQVRSAAIRADLDKIPNDAGLTADFAAAEAAVKAAAEALAAVKTRQAELERQIAEVGPKVVAATAAKEAADTTAAEAVEAAKTALAAKTVAVAASLDADAVLKAATEEKTAGDVLADEATKAAAAATAAKQAADQLAKQTAEASKPQNVPAFAVLAPILITVNQAPATLGVNPANGGAVKRGTTLDVDVKVNRINGFKGPVTVSLFVPPEAGPRGLQAAEVVVEDGQTDGRLVVTVSGDAPTGVVPFAVVQAKCEFKGPAVVDQPVAINVTE